MDKPMSNFGFRMMSFAFKIRNFFKPRHKVLVEVGIKTGDNVLDYGCGPGSYVKATSELVGSEGKVYALDIHPLAIKKVQSIASKYSIGNIETIESHMHMCIPYLHLLELIYKVSYLIMTYI